MAVESDLEYQNQRMKVRMYLRRTYLYSLITCLIYCLLLSENAKTVFTTGNIGYIWDSLAVYMGEVFSQLNTESIFASFDWIWKSFHRESSILILGLDNAGKTAILYSLQLGEAITYTIPTIGFNVEEVEMENLKIKMWDIGGQDKIRALWPHYFQQTSGIVFVVDSNDHDRFPLAKQELHTLISHKDNVGKPVLILANKQDLPNAANKEAMVLALELSSIKTSEWFVIECSATNNQRARLGFEWMASNI